MTEETIPEMRERIEAQNKAIKDKDTEIGKLNSQLRVRDAREAFRGAGYNPKHGDLFATTNPEGEITAEAVAAFAGEWDLQPAASDSIADEGTDDTSDADDGTDTLGSLGRSGTRAGEGGGGSSLEKTLTRQDWMELQATDPVAASQALSQGRVLISEGGNLRTGQSAVRGRNPYEPSPSDD
jgi:hypothetical protein